MSLLLIAPEPVIASELSHAGPLFDQFHLTLEEGHRTEAMGPFFYRERADTQRAWGLPPLFARAWDMAADVNEMDFLYPVAKYRRYGTEYRWDIMEVFSFAGGDDQQGARARRFTLFPIYFQQRSPDSNQNYTAFVPFYGHLQNRLFRDEIFFVMFPIYGQSRKGNVVTDNYVYPIFHLRHGEALRGWQFWPLLGHEHKDPTRRSIGFGDTEVVGGHDGWFVLWPFFFDQKSGIGTENPTKEQALLPIYDYQRSPLRDSTTVGWPFFTHVTDREKHFRELDCPWPLIVFARGEGKTTSRVFPFYSHAQNTNLESTFYLWPVYKMNRAHGGTLDRTRTRILFFLYSDTVEKDTASGEYRRRIDCLPFFTMTRTLSGARRLQILAPLEPFVPGNPSVEREYSPVWSVWRSESNPVTHAASQSFLWNLYRHESRPGAKRTSALFGLYQYKSGSEGTRLSVMYIPIINNSRQTRRAAELPRGGDGR
ncbi:MAG TPA: hypothetical protein VFD66_04385 [Verrucomicrobiae bacterium]|nr:hypothetical protein [Verrucomicrobiae bacterium]